METFAMEVTPGAWALVAEGASCIRFGIQLDVFSVYAGLDAGACAIALGAAAPDLASNDWVLLSLHGDRSMSFDLPADCNVYVRSVARGGTTVIRGYREDR
jgi:hypothetical protein